jgi:hypothetical protein
MIFTFRTPCSRAALFGIQNKNARNVLSFRPAPVIMRGEDHGAGYKPGAAVPHLEVRDTVSGS